MEKIHLEKDTMMYEPLHNVTIIGNGHRLHVPALYECDVHNTHVITSIIENSMFYYSRIGEIKHEWQSVNNLFYDTERAGVEIVYHDQCVVIKNRNEVF